MATLLRRARDAAVPGGFRPWHERFLALFITLRPGEARSLLLFFSYAFLLLVCYYILKTLREPLLLVGASAAIKSYAYATVALLMLFLVPLYGFVFRHTAKSQVARWVTAFFVANLGVLSLAGRAGLDIGFIYYVWVGLFGVTILAQFWAHAADVLDVESGQRLFPAIMAGATLGGLAGPSLVRASYDALSPWSLLLVAMALLALTLPLIGWTRQSVPEGSRNRHGGTEPRVAHPLGGFALIFRDRYLLLLACLAVLLNCVNTTGEYVLTELVVRHAEEQVANQPWLDKGSLIAEFYGDFFFTVNALTVIAQVLLVGRVFRWIGVQGALLVLPVVALIGYGLVVFLPIFSILRIVKVIENSADYSVMNTARQALYLPLSTAAKYEGKIAADAFFWRFGDLLQAGIIFVGLNWLGFEAQHFALLNMALAVVWLAVAVQLARRYSTRTATAARGPAPAAAPARRRYPAAPSFAFARAVPVWLVLGIGVTALTGSVPADAEIPPSAEADRSGLSRNSRWSTEVAMQRCGVALVGTVEMTPSNHLRQVLGSGARRQLQETYGTQT